MKSSKALLAQRAVMASFRDEFLKLHGYYHYAEYAPVGMNLGGEWILRDGISEDEVDSLRRRVGELAGAASSISSRHVQQSYKPPGTLSTVRFDPIAQWSDALDPGSSFFGASAKDVTETVDHVIGRLDLQRIDAETRERSLAGRVARFIRFPIDVREAAGFKPHTAAGKAAFSITAVIQGVLVAVVTAGVLGLLSLALR